MICFRKSARLLAAAVLLAVFAGFTGAFGQQAAVPDPFKAVTYRDIGPTAQGGRFVDFAVPLQQPYTFYAAAGSGGLWKTVNNGETFDPHLRLRKGLSRSATSPWRRPIRTSSTSARAKPTAPAAPTGATGSTNRPTPARPGRTSACTNRTTSAASSSIRPTRTSSMSPPWAISTPRIRSAASSRRATAARPGPRPCFVDARTGCVDVVMDPNDPETLYAATYDKLRKPWTYQIGGPGTGIHKSTDGGTTWTKLGGGLPDRHPRPHRPDHLSQEHRRSSTPSSRTPTSPT